ncbi:MAG: ATP-binding protein [Gammaproteobacteria bacterium]|nr:ATP-binding protein [Gammaproteobacteria bacterium]
MHDETNERLPGARHALLLCQGESLSIVHAGADSRRLLGTPVDALLGRPLAEIVLESRRDRLAGELHAALGAADHASIETVCTRHDGSPLQVRMHVHRIRVAASLFHVVILDDGVAEPHAASSLHPDDSPFVEFVGRLGHDVNNLLSTIIGSVGLLREEAGADEGQAQLLDDAYSAARECADLVEDLMAATGKQVLEPREIDVNEVVRRIADLLQRTVSSDIGVRLELASDLPATLADPDRLEAVLLNVTLNAREAIRDGGNIHLATARVGDDASRVAVSVRDDGPGIPETLRARVLEPLFSTKPSGTGRGLGLSIANGFARQSGGALHIKSQPGEGTTVTLELPTIPRKAT